MNSKYKISFCTVSMNRLYHIKQTLLKNIRDNISYGNIEFVVLDYNSKDNLFEWIKAEGKEYIERDILKIFRTTDPPIFDRSHSRNMCLKLATGDILCNVDADNFIGVGFADYINAAFQQERDIFMTGHAFMRDAIGRFCIKKEDFLSINGYNENIKSYGFEDLELYDRLVIAGKKQRSIEDIKFLNIIHHSSFERIANEKLNQGLKKIFVAYINPYESDLILLYEHTALKVGLINYAEHLKKMDTGKMVSSNRFNFLKKPLQEAFYFNKEENIMRFTNSSGMQELMYSPGFTEGLIDATNGTHFYEIADEKLRDDIILLLSELTNKQTMIKYLTRHEKVNKTGFGKGTVLAWNNHQRSVI